VIKGKQLLIIAGAAFLCGILTSYVGEAQAEITLLYELYNLMTIKSFLL
jgi:hypothetical protein